MLVLDNPRMQECNFKPFSACSLALNQLSYSSSHIMIIYNSYHLDIWFWKDNLCIPPIPVPLPFPLPVPLPILLVPFNLIKGNQGNWSTNREVLYLLNPFLEHHSQKNSFRYCSDEFSIHFMSLHNKFQQWLHKSTALSGTNSNLLSQETIHRLDRILTILVM